MKYIVIIRHTVIVTLLFAVTGCNQRSKIQLTEVAQSEALWTGVAVSKTGRIFVNYPRWFPDVTTSVAELSDSSVVRPYPDLEWNTFDPSGDLSSQFVCVQSVYIDGDDYLWILDPAPSFLIGDSEVGPKLLKVDLATNEVIRTYLFDQSVAPPSSYLNDVRIDTRRNFAYITDSGLGAIIVVDLTTGVNRRLLADHASTKAEDITLIVGGSPLLEADSSAVKIHSDGLALDSRGEYLYYQALTGRHLYRIKTSTLRNAELEQDELELAVEALGESGASDGIIFGQDGNLYFTSIENNAISRYTADGTFETVIRDDRLKWPDSFSVAADGSILVTTSQIHLLAQQTEPFKIYSFKP
ncbi:L-dopachrome tautomerase-related protein [Candidatus Neomarinimicrobiota bacterium]